MSVRSEVEVVLDHLMILPKGNKFQNISFCSKVSFGHSDRAYELLIQLDKCHRIQIFHN